MAFHYASEGNGSDVALPTLSTMENVRLEGLYKSLADIDRNIQAYAYPAMFTIGGFWNLLIMVYFIEFNLKKGLKRMSSYHFHVIHLALTDLLVNVGNGILKHYKSKLSWELGKWGCILFERFVMVICLLASSWNLVFISYSRYRSIVYPLAKRLSKRKCSLISLIIWMVPCLANIYPFMKTKLLKLPPKGALICMADLSSQLRMVHFSANFLLDSFIPLALMLYFYRKMARAMTQEENANHLSSQSHHNNRRALKIIRRLVFLFTISVVTTRFLLFLRVFLDMYAFKRPPFYKIIMMHNMISSSFVHILFYSNNMLNIFIYAKMIPGFRRFLLTFFTFGMYERRNVINRSDEQTSIETTTH